MFKFKAKYVILLKCDRDYDVNLLQFQSADLPTFEESTYELSYNAGTTLAMRGKYNEALPVLKKAEQVCSESVIDDGGTEEEAKEEAAIIRFA